MVKFSKYLYLLVVFVFTIFWGFKFKERLFSTTDTDWAGKQYSTSQYVLGDGAKEKIKDSTLYIYAGYAYVRGENPTQINFEHPPLGKYILGLSWRLFDNVMVINLILYTFSLIIFWQLSGKIIHNYFLKILSLIILCSLALIPEYTFQGMLDTQLLFFTLLFFFSLFCIRNKNIKIILVGVSLGAFISVKYFIPSVFPLVLILFITNFKNKSFFNFIKIIFIVVTIYLFSYLIYFQSHSIFDFIKFEWFRFRWWTGERSMPKFLLLDTILLGRFKGWWGSDVYEYATSWSWVWPASLFGFVTSLSVISKRKLYVQLITLFAFIQFAFYIFGSASNERYLIQLLPFWILLTTSFVEFVFGGFLTSKRPRVV